MPSDCLECGYCESCIDRSIAAAEPEPTPLPEIGRWVRDRFGRIVFSERSDLGLWVAAVQTYDSVAVGLATTHEGSLRDLYRQLMAGR